MIPDARVTYASLIDYVTDRVVELTNNHQHPSLGALGGQNPTIALKRWRCRQSRFDNSPTTIGKGSPRTFFICFPVSGLANARASAHLRQPLSDAI